MFVRNCGHEILWAPPWFSDFNPIELLLSYIKKQVALQYSKFTTFTQIRDRLSKELVKSYTEIRNAIISNVITHVQNLVGNQAETIPLKEEVIDELPTSSDPISTEDSENTVPDSSDEDQPSQPQRNYLQDKDCLTSY